MSSQINEFAQFLGHFHPMLVHLPVGGLVVLGALEVLASFPRFKSVAQNRRTILAVVTCGAIAAAACGWLLAAGGGYDPQLLNLHRWLGVGVAVACVLTFLLGGAGWRLAYRATLGVTLALLVVAGHYGSEITHGRDFLTLHAPGPLRAFFGVPASAAQADPAPAGTNSVYVALIEPVLQRRCVACHGTEKQKGQLRLDSLANLRRGGENGAAIVPGNAGQSPMIRRLLLPLDDEDHMPPDGKPQPTPAEITLLQWWINAEAPETRPQNTPNDAK